MEWPVGDIRYTTQWTVDSWSGPKSAECSVAVPLGYEDDFLLANQPFEVYSPAGGLLWGGLTDNPDWNEAGVTIHAVGYGATLKDFMAFENTGTPETPIWVKTFDADIAVDQAVLPRTVDGQYGAKFTRAGVELGEWDAEADAEAVTVMTLLSRIAVAAGQHLYVDNFGQISYRDDPTEPSWIVESPGYKGTADDTYATGVWGQREDGWVFATDADAIEAAQQFGAKEITISLLNLGDISAANAKTYLEARIGLVGHRMGWTDPVALPDGYGVQDYGGVYTLPRWVQAGDMLEIPGVIDSRSNPTTFAAIRWVLGEVTINESDYPTGSATPVGFVPRDFNSSLTPPEKRPENPTTTEAA